MNQDTKLTKSEKIKWFMTVLVPVFIYFIPTNDLYTNDMRLFLVITIAAILVVAFELVDIIISSIFMLFAYTLTGIAPTSVAFQGFTSSSTFLVLGCLVLVAVLDESGVLERISYWCMIRFGNSFKGILWGIFIAGLLTSAMTMGNSFALIAAFAYGIIRALRLEGSKAASAIGLVAAVSTVAVRGFIYAPMLIAVQVAQSQSILGESFHLNWYNVLVNNWPIIISVVITVWLITKMYKPEGAISGKDYFVEQYEKLGAMKVKEKKTLFVLLLIILWMLLDPILPVSSDYALILLPWLCFFPFINVGSSNTLKKVSFSTVFFVPACFGIGNVATSLGMGQMIADMVMPVATQAGSIGVLAVVYALTILLNFLMTPYAIHACMTVPFMNIALQMGIDPYAINFMLMHGSDMVLMPYEYTPYLVVFAFGMIKMTEFIKVMAVKMLVTTAVLFAIIVPFWGILGLY